MTWWVGATDTHRISPEVMLLGFAGRCSPHCSPSSHTQHGQSLYTCWLLVYFSSRYISLLGCLPAAGVSTLLYVVPTHVGCGESCPVVVASKHGHSLPSRARALLHVARCTTTARRRVVVPTRFQSSHAQSCPVMPRLIQRTKASCTARPSCPQSQALLRCGQEALACGLSSVLPPARGDESQHFSHSFESYKRNHRSGNLRTNGTARRPPLVCPAVSCFLWYGGRSPSPSLA